jgi:hypothetical protein
MGATAPDGTYTARYLHWSNHPDRLIPVLRQIWTDTFDRDTARMVEALLARDWSSLDAQPSSSDVLSLIAGVGVESPGGTRPRPYVGRVSAVDSGDMEWLYLIDADTATITVYEATCHHRWLRHSLHHLAPVEELFTPAGRAGELSCTVCGAVDEIEYQEMPSMVGYGRDTCTRCTRCGSKVTTDPEFGALTTRSDTDRTS